MTVKFKLGDEKMINFAQDKLQIRVYDAMLDLIKNGEFPEGKLPSEPKLAKEMGISRSTLRNTLSSMEKEGIIIRKHGIGTFVNLGINQIKVKINEPTIVFDIIQKSGHSPSIKFNKIIEIKANYLLQDKLNLSETDQLIVLKRVFCADVQPAVYVEEHIPKKYICKKWNEDDLPNSIYSFTEEYTRERIRFSLTDIKPFLAQDKLVYYLNCKENDPILLMEETHLNNSSKPIIFSRVYVVDRFIRFQVVKNNP